VREEGREGKGTGGEGRGDGREEVAGRGGGVGPGNRENSTARWVGRR